MTTPKLPQAATLLTGTPEAFTETCNAALSHARAKIAALKQLTTAQRDQLLPLYDEATTETANMIQRAGLGREVHPSEAFRSAAEQCEQSLEAFQVELAQDRQLYDALSALEATQLDAVSSHWLAKTLREFRRAGVDRDDATRLKVKTLNDELVKIGQIFSRNIRDDVRSIEISPKELDGLPSDYVKAHPPNTQGKVKITTNTPDYVPFMVYAKSAKSREALWRAYRSRAYPANAEVLKELLAKRNDLATMLGYENWAAFATETKMVKTAAAAQAFIDRGRNATLERAQRDLSTLLARKQKDFPGAKQIEPWEQEYYEDRIKAEQYGLDTQALRGYFEYARVKQGVIDITSHIFGIRFERVTNASVWHSDVETYDLYEGTTPLGRIHLDMHPREGKYKHAAQFGLSIGRLENELPEGVLVCNFPKPGGLLQHSEVETFFHEFGHLLHEVFAGNQKWGGVSGIRTEWDFVEVPSMLLQEWPFDASVLSRFAKHHETNETISADMVSKLRAAHDFGVGLATRRQFFLAQVSLSFHNRKPGFDTSSVLKEEQARFEPFRREYVPGTHFELSFGHLDGYSAAYYTYQWSSVIAKDLLSRFEKDGMLDTRVASDYRKKVLEPGGSKEASMLVSDFLGRPYSFDAFEKWLNAR